MNTTWFLLLGLALVFAGLYWIGLTLLKRWLRKQAEQGILGVIVSILVLLFVASAIIFGVLNFLAYLFGGALLGLVFAVPVYFGMPWYGIILYGAGIGVLTYFVWMFYNHFDQIFPLKDYRLVGIWRANIGHFMADRSPVDLATGKFRFDSQAIRELGKEVNADYVCTIQQDVRTVKIFN